MENIVYVAVSRDWFDYLATGATLLLSVIAVVIAVSTARRQNKIALFEKRSSVLKTVRIVTVFAESIKASPINYTTITNATAHILSYWVFSQEVMLNHLDELRFVPRSIVDDVEGNFFEIDVGAMNRDTDIIMAQFTKDALILEQGYSLFAEPIKTEIDLLKQHYSALMIALLNNYGNSEISDKTVAAYKQFLLTCDKFSIGSRLYYKMWSSVSI